MSSIGREPWVYAAVPTRRAGTVRSVRTDPHRLAGAAALVTAALAAAGALTPALSVPHGVAVPDFTSARAVLIAAINIAGGSGAWLEAEKPMEADGGAEPTVK